MVFKVIFPPPINILNVFPSFMQDHSMLSPWTNKLGFSSGSILTWCGAMDMLPPCHRHTLFMGVIHFVASVDQPDCISGATCNPPCFPSFPCVPSSHFLLFGSCLQSSQTFHYSLIPVASWAPEAFSYAKDSVCLILLSLPLQSPTFYFLRQECCMCCHSLSIKLFLLIAGSLPPMQEPLCVLPLLPFLP